MTGFIWGMVVGILLTIYVEGAWFTYSSLTGAHGERRWFALWVALTWPFEAFRK